jgi:hypothetical protein
MMLRADQRRLAFEVEQRLAARDTNVILAKPLGRISYKWMPASLGNSINPSPVFAKIV